MCCSHYLTACSMPQACTEAVRGQTGMRSDDALAGGSSSALDELDRYFTFSGMPVASSTYWNMMLNSGDDSFGRDNAAPARREHGPSGEGDKGLTPKRRFHRNSIARRQPAWEAGGTRQH